MDGKPNIRFSYDDGIFGDALATQRAQVVAQLRKEKGGTQKLLGVGGAHLTRAQSSNMQIVGAPCLPAWQRYTGVVWDHLDLASLTATQRNAFIKRIIVPSGLLGLVRADDPLPDYRLKMGARLAPFGTMSKWWNEPITDALVAVVKKKLVVDLLPNEHRAAINWELLDNVVRIDLVSHSGAVVGGHNAKAAKGLLARHLLVSANADVRRTVASFKHPEYSAKVTT
ncbi:MAG: peroxide stress protein YaaA [Ilumatobacteraceae bacterium]|jgi:hypothetical protein